MATFEELDNDVKEFDKQETALSVSSAIKKSPEQSAKVYSLSKEKGLPFDYVDRNYDKVSAPNVSDVGPNVAQLLRDREKAAVAHDDIDNLNWWETAAQEAGNVGKVLYSGANTASAAAYGIVGGAYNALSAVTTAPFRPFASDEEINKYDLFGESGKYITGLAQQQNAYADQIFPTKSVINSSVLGGIKSATMNVPALALGVATDNPVAALNSMIAMTYGNSYVTAKDAGLSETNSILYAGNQALAERVTEGIPVGRLFKDLEQNSGFLKTMGMQMATEVPSEELATLWQDAIDWASLHPEKTLADFKSEREGAFVDTLIATVVATGLQTGAIHTVDKLTRGREDEQIQAIADKANESKVNARTPDVFSEHVQNVAEAYGAPDNVYLDAKDAKPLLQTMVKDSAYDLISQQIDEAEAVGGDVVIPMGEFASKVATSKNFDLLKGSFRLSPDSPTGSQITNQPDRIASLLDDASKQVQLKTRADQIYQEVSKQLINSGQMNADTAKVNASLIPAYVTTKAARSGMSVDDVYGMMGLKIEGPASSSKPQQQVLSQSAMQMIDVNPALKGYMSLAQSDEAFKLPKSNAKTLDGIFSDLEGDKGIKLSRFPEMDEGDTKVWKVNPDKNTMGLIFEDPKNVWIDVADLEQGQGGQRIYNEAANYAHNSGKVFIGDPAGLSDVAVSRRLENMLSSALKFGTTKHLAPHPKQIKGTEAVAGLNWKPGNDQHNITEMIKASYDATKKQFPEIENLVYDGNTDQFINKVTGDEFTREDFAALARSKRAEQKGAKSPITAGSTTLERAVLTHSLLSSSGTEQSAILDRLGNEHAQRLGGVLYQSPIDLSEFGLLSDSGKLLANRINLFDRLSSVFLDTFPVERLDKPVIIKSFMDASWFSTKSVSDLLKDNSTESQEYGFLGEPSFVSMLTQVNRAAAIDPKVLDAIVESVPVDMVNNLFGSQSAAKVALHNESVFKDALSVNAELPISSAGRTSLPIAFLVFESARMTAKLSAVADARGSSIKGLKALLTIENNFTGQNNEPLQRASIDLSTSTIRLTENSDLTSFLHELGHLFLHMEGRLFSHPNATPEMKADGQVILDWLGLDSFEQLNQYETNDAAREAHEKFARGFEKYLGEGKAPTIELKAVFRRFAAWMKQVYRDLRNLNVELNDDIRAVMDRMLATDEQINRAKNVFDPLFKDAKDAGMTEAEFKAYTIESSPDSAKEVLLVKMIKQLKREYTKWWKDESIVVADQVRKEIAKQPLYSALEYMRAGGTTKEAKALAEDIDGLEEQLRKITRGNVTVKQAIARAGGISRKEAIDSGIDHEIVKARFASKGNQLFPAKGGMSFDGVAELLNQEGYQFDAKGALEFVSSALQSDRFLNQDIEAQAENLRSEISAKSAHLDGFGANRLNREDVDVHFFGDIPGRFIGLTSKNGMSPDDMAAIHGLASGSDLLDQINTAPSLSQKVKEQTHAEMVKRHGDILTDGTIEEEAAQAIRNPEHAKKLMAELSALTRKTKSPAIDREAIKAYAKETIGKMAYSKIRPAQYRSAEVRAAREAAIAKNKGDFAGAQKAKQQEIINFYLSREATAVKEKADANRKYLQSVQVRKFNPKDVNADYITQMQAIANLYDFRTSSSDNQDRARSRLQAISAWIDAQAEKEESGYCPVIIDSILNDINSASKNGTLDVISIPSYREMTADNIQGIAEQVRNLRYVGGQLSENSKELLKQESKRVGDSIRSHSKGVVDIPEEISKRDRRMSGLREFGQDHIRLANQIEELDGYKEFGPLFESFYQDIIDSSNKELKLKRSTFEDIKVALSGLKSSDMAEGKDEKTFTYVQAESNPPIKKTLTLSRRARIVFGLYWGSPEGREAIRQGHGLTDADAQQILNSLEEKDLNAIEGIWKANEAHWPDVSRINQKLKGVTLPKVEHVPYVVNGRTLPGGYLRLYYQYDQKDSIREIKAEDLLMTRTGNRLAKQTKNGSRNERVGSGGRKVSWEFNNVFTALDETIHDIAFAETASKASQFIRSPDVSSAIIDGYGKEKYDSMVGALSGVISGNTAISHPISGFLQHFRVAQTYGMLGYSIRNFVQQPLAYANVFGKSATSFEGFGEMKVLSEAVKFAASPRETMKFVDGLSEFMVNRTALINRDTSEIKQRLSNGSMAGSAWENLKDHAFDIQTIGDSLVCYPAWMSAYNEGLRKFANQKKAITFADEFVSATVGSGMVKDMSPMLQGGGRVGQAIGSEQLKSITFMGSFFNVNMNLMRDSFKRSNYVEIGGVKTIPTSPEFYRQMAWYLVVPALLGAWITGDDPKDDEGFFTWAAKEVGSYGLSAIFFVRDLVSLARGFGPSSSYTRALDSVAKLTKEAVKIYKGEKDVDEKTGAKVLRSAGMLFPIPFSGQAARTLESLGSDDEFNPYKALVTGVDR